ncbi:MAG: hypothetical protein ABWZ64_10430, partial [Xanthobacteraceae bacterium]
TRWHLDDPVGRLIERVPDAKVFRYPAIAEEDEKNRRKGEALFPEQELGVPAGAQDGNGAGQLGERVPAEPDHRWRRYVSN